ncbi:MAG TPA: flagellar FlbD family protein [Chthonomonadaceae bacterium]|nr:flagellar FlbD family protein [Chthonomonadaceae bacterium]
MIKVTRFNQSELLVNSDLIEFIETTPDTVITLITGRKVLVRETAEEVRQRILAYRREAGPLLPHLHFSHGEPDDTAH